MKYFRRFLLRVILVYLLAVISGYLALAQTPLDTRTLMVMPFENKSSAPGLEWIAQAFPEVLSQRMTSSRLYVMGRDDRDYAFDRSGIPTTIVPSRATIYRVAEQMDADYVVMGTYNFDGRVFSATAQLLDMKRLHLSQAVDASGPLTSLIDLQTMLAWRLLQQIPDHPVIPEQEFVKQFPQIRLDAFEAYIRGTLTTAYQERIHYFHDALKLNPNYTAAMLQLGKTYYDNREYVLAANWFDRIPKTDAASGQATFLLGMSEFYAGNYDKAYAAFNYLLNRMPLIELYNNIGVVEARRGHRASAVQYFSKAVNADPNDADYRFNLAVAQYKNGDSTSAARQLKEELQLRPSDGEAKALMEMINRGVPPPTPVAASPGAMNSMLPSNANHVPLERIKRSYSEASYRQLEMEIHNFDEARLTKLDAHSHSAYHVERGKELLAQDLPQEAEIEFRDAISTDYNNDIAHAQLAMLLEKRGDLTGARAEAQTSVRIKPNVDGLLVLTRLDLKQNQLQNAAEEVDRALGLAPANPNALALKRDIAARQSGAK